jgi:plastocyanin
VRRSIRSSLAPVAIMAAGAAFLIAGPAEAGKRARVREAQIGSNFFAPGKLTVKAGDRVRFRWEEFGFEAHDVNVRKGPAKFHSPLQAGGTWTTKKLSKPGKYSLFCSQHPDEMRMTLVVKKR